MTSQARAKLSFENLQNLFAFAQRPKQNRNRADIERVRRQPEQVRSDAIQLSKNCAEVMSARRHGKTHHLLDRFDPNQTVGNCGNVIEPIPVGRDHRVHAVLGDLLHAAMEIADVAIEIDDCLAVELQDHAQHAVR